MNIEHTNKDIHTGLHAGLGVRAGSGWWTDFKHWCGRHPRLSRVVIIGLILAVVALVIWAIYPKPAVRNGFNNGPQPVGVAVAKDAPINVTLNGLGTVTPLATATVRPQVGGMLTKLFHRRPDGEGGRLLAEIDPALIRRRWTSPGLGARPGQSRQCQAGPRPLSGAGRTERGLRPRCSPPKPRWCVPIGRGHRPTGNVEAAEINLGYTQIMSPVVGPGRPASGGYRQYRLGRPDYGRGGGDRTFAHVGAVHHAGRQYLTGDGTIEYGRRAGGGAFDRSQTVKLASGKLATWIMSSTPPPVTVKLRAMFDNRDGKLFPSQFVNIRLLVDTLQHQTVIPVSAVQRGADGTFVFVVSPDKSAANQGPSTSAASN